MVAERQLILAAYLEWRVAKAYSTGSTIEIEPRETNVRNPMLSSSWPPSKFVREELGYGPGSGPSLSWTCRVLAKHNRDAVKVLGSEAPWKYQWPLRRVQA